MLRLQERPGLVLTSVEERLFTGLAAQAGLALLTPLIESLSIALEALREITRGVFPAQLVRAGLPKALGSLLAHSGSAGQLVVEKPAIGRRFDPEWRPRRTSAWPRQRASWTLRFWYD